MPLLKKTSRHQICQQPAIPGEEVRVDILVTEVLGQSYPNKQQVKEALKDPDEACLIAYERVSGLPRAVTIINLADGRVLHLAALCSQERDDLLEYARVYASRQGVAELECPQDLYRSSIR